MPGRTSDDATHERIVRAAEACFARWGVLRTRMDDIANEAGIARPTLYRYFASKEVLQQAVMIRHIQRRAAELHRTVPRRGPSGPLLLKALLAGIIESSRDGVPESLLGMDVVRDTARLVGRSDAIFDAMYGYWIPYLEHAAERGELRKGVSTERAVRWLTMTVFYFLTLPEVAPDAQHLARDLRTFVVNAIVTD